MSFRLFKEAQIASKLDASELKILESARAALGKSSIVDLLESFTPDPEQYQEWLRVAAEVAAERGRHWSKRSFVEFMLVDVFENDPYAPPFDMQEMVANKLWSDYQSAHAGARIEKAARAKEEEEALQRSNDVLNSEYVDDEEDVDIPAGGELSADDVPAGAEVDDDSLDGFGDEGSDLPPADDELGDDEGTGEEGRVLSDADVDAIVQKILGHYEDKAGEELKPELAQENEEKTVMSAKTGDEVKPKQEKSVTTLQHLLSGPRSNITQAQKDIEAEGEAAWKAHQLPENPHPKKSIAHGAWERGMKRAVKAHFGFDEKPVQPTSKQKKK